MVTFAGEATASLIVARRRGFDRQVISLDAVFKS